MNGGPLNYSQKPLLFNSVTSDDIGYFVDSVKSTRMLQLKKYGITLPAKENSILIGSYSKACHFPGSYKNVLLVLDPPCPCETCNYEYAIGVTGVVQNPGVFNSQITPETRTYGGRFEALGACSNGILADSDIQRMELDIIAQITNDNGMGSYSGSGGAIVEAYRYYIFDVTSNDADSGFTLTKPDGTTVVFTATHTDLTAGIFSIELNGDATVNTLLFAARIGDNRFLVTSKQAGYAFSLGTLVNCTQFQRGIRFVAKSKEQKFFLQFDNGFATAHELNWFEVDDSAATFAQNDTDLSIYVDGVLHSETNSTGAGAANLVTDINVAQQTDHGLYGSAYSTGKVVIAGLDLTTKISVAVASTSVSTISCKGFTPEGEWERLTADDVWREFSQLGFYGAQAMQVRQEMPIKDAEYCKYVISCKMSTYGLHGASHGGSYDAQVIAYVLKSQAATFDTALTNWLS